MTTIVAVIFLITVISGCASSKIKEEEVLTSNESSDMIENEATEEATDEKESIYPMTLQHAFGEIVIESKPERVATISWGNQDVPLALGVLPVGFSKANYGVIDDSGLLPWTKAKLDELGIDNPVLFNDLSGLNFEEINDVQPDVILAAYSGITQEDYELLSEIAPVVAYPSLPWQTFWREQITYDAAGMGLVEEGDALIAELEALIESKTSEFQVLEGKTAAFFYFNPADLGKFYVYLPTDPRAAYLTDLGMAFPESVTNLAKESDSFALELSAENADVLQDVDIIITYGTDGLLEMLQEDALVGTIPAIARGSVAIIEDGTPLAAAGTPSALSIPATIDEYLITIGEAAEKVE